MNVTRSNADVAQCLLAAKAFAFHEQGFRLTSGRLSPVYMDCRRLLGHPMARSRVIDLACTHLANSAVMIDVVAGGETAGIPFAALLADRWALPMQYVRKQPKGHGHNAFIEGYAGRDRLTLLVEDQTTTGGSLVRFVDALRQSRQRVRHALVLFDYDGALGPRASTVLAEADVILHSLCNWSAVLHVMEPGAEKELLRTFLDDPDGWKPA